MLKLAFDGELEQKTPVMSPEQTGGDWSWVIKIPALYAETVKGAHSRRASAEGAKAKESD